MIRGIGRQLKAIDAFTKTENASGYVLLAATFLALVFANSPLSAMYTGWFSQPFPVQIGGFAHTASVNGWIKDGLMAIFFLLVGLEIKREVMAGELSDPKTLALPVAAALGGMVLPALVFLGVSSAMGASFVEQQGWPIPVATDIAFALMVLTLAAPGVTALKVFLLTLAVVDDLGAVVLIATIFAHSFDTVALVMAGLCVAGLFAMNWLGVRRLWAYLVLGLVLWAFVLESGLHPTLAGVVVAAAIPFRPSKGTQIGPLEDLEHALHPWSAFGILPLFAFANAGFSLAGLEFSALFAPVSLGVIAALVIGKPLGVLLGCFGATLITRSGLPKGLGWKQVIGAGLLAGIGFTMSLFIATLAFENQSDILGAEARIGVGLGSLVSATLGYLWLKLPQKAVTAPAKT